MSKDAPKGDNPFAVLNKKAFPAARKAHGQIVRWTDRRETKPVQAETGPEPDEDAALFLNAVSSATPLGQTRPHNPAASSTCRPGDTFANSLPLHPNLMNKKSVAKAPAPDRIDQPADHHAKENKVGPETADVQSGNFAALLAASLDSGSQSAAPTRPLPPDRRRPTPPPNGKEPASATVLNASSETEDELAFTSAMRDVAPLDGKGGRAIQPEVPQPHTAPAAATNPLQDFIDGRIEFSLASTDEYVEGHVIGLDLGIVGRLQAGQLSPEAHLDLHGLNAEQAFQTLVGFMRHSYMCGRRVVLVVPGRGRNSPAGIGVLREKVQEWFTQEPFRRVILAFCTARKVDGGPGSLYVLLRKFRKDRGKVIWDRNPTDPDLYI